jgi:hypothetical protein
MERYDPFLSAIEIPPLSERKDELERIIREYAEDALAIYGTTSSVFLPEDFEWVRKHSATSLPDIEKATLRLAAIRDSPSLCNAAARLGMAPVSLSRWIDRREET